MTITKNEKWITGVVVLIILTVAGWFGVDFVKRRNDAADARQTNLAELVGIVASMKDSLQRQHYEQFTAQCRTLHDNIIKGHYNQWLDPPGHIIPTVTTGELSILRGSVDYYLSNVDRYNSHFGPPSDCRESTQRDVADMLIPVVDEVNMILMWKTKGAVE